MSLNNKQLNIYFNILSFLILIATVLYYIGYLEIPHPEWATPFIRFTCPLVASFILLLFEPKEIKGFLNNIINRRLNK
jgi:hypothetical protein